MNNNNNSVCSISLSRDELFNNNLNLQKHTFDRDSIMTVQ